MNCAHGIRMDKDCRYCATGTEPATLSAASNGHKSAVQSAKKLLAVGQACIRCGQSPDAVIYATSIHTILVSDLLAMAQFSGDL